MAMSWTVFVFCLAAAGAAGAGAAGSGAAGESFLSHIGRTLRAEMAGVLVMAAVNYSTPVINATYVARVEFDMRAMGALYNSTHAVIDVIAHKQAYPEDLVSVSDGHVELPAGGLRAQWRPLLAHYAGPAAVLLAAALLAAALPIAGLFWCCCYWCRGGQRRRPFDRKYDACAKGMLAILLIALLTLFLFGVVCAFATDSQVESGAAGSSVSVRAGLQDAREFLNATQAHARWLLVTNYRELERKLDAMLTSSGHTISVQLGEFSRAVAVTALTGMVQQLDAVQADLQAVQTLTAKLRDNAERLNAALRSVKKQLLETLARCSQPQCVQLQEKHKIGQLDTEIHYSQMPDVSELLRNVTALLDSDIKADVSAGQQVFRDIQMEIQRSVDQHIPSVHDAIAETGRKLEAVADEIQYLAGNASQQLQQQTAAADLLRDLYHQYGPYRRYVGIGAATALLAITVLMACGLMCGVCGKRPDVYGASDCCNKGAGSKCLLCGTALVFVLGGAVSLVLLLYFAAGVAAQRFICDPLTEPRGNRLFGDLEQLVELERALFNERADPAFNLTYVMVRCHDNRTVYETFQLHRLYELGALRARAAAAVSARVSALDPLSQPRAPVTILRPSARRKLRMLADTGLSDFDFDRILDALETNMTSLSLEGLSSQLVSAADALAPRPGFSDVSMSLRGAAQRLRQHQRDIVEPMLRDTDTLNSTAVRLRELLRFNHSSQAEAIAYLMHETAQAEVFLNTQGPDIVRNMTHEFAQVVAARLDEYLSRVEHAARHEVGRCGPLSNAFNATRDAHCRNILMPVNGYWLSLAWCVLLFVPVMVTAQRLARLYLHVDPYPGPLVEAEYLYDAYADRDNVPLANAYKAEKRAGREARRGGGGGSSGGGGGGAGAGGRAEGRGEGARGAGAEAAVAPPLDAHHARRYNDMAPKHWEEGPPRYHGPTEYERPPPYYYPGPNDRQ